MTTYRVEVLGRVPYGLTHNDVHASFLSMLQEHDTTATVVKRRLAGDMVSLIARFKSEDAFTAAKAARYAASGITGFSFDIIGPYTQR